VLDAMCDARRRTVCWVAVTSDTWIGAASTLVIVPSKCWSTILRGSSRTKAAARSSAQLPKGWSARCGLVDHSMSTLNKLRGSRVTQDIACRKNGQIPLVVAFSVELCGRPPLFVERSTPRARAHAN
jgi:hypothetical protein